MWSLVLAKDLFTRFEKKGLMDKATALEYRADVLAPGGSVDAAAMVEKFLGRPYQFDAFKAWLEKSPEASK
jgi:thimet oligopeptidase